MTDPLIMSALGAACDIPAELRENPIPPQECGDGKKLIERPVRPVITFPLGAGYAVRHVSDYLVPSYDDVQIIESSKYVLFRDNKRAAIRVSPDSQISTAAEAFELFRDTIELESPLKAQYLAEQLLVCPPWSRRGRGRRADVFRPCTDEGNAQRFADECRGWLIFDKTSEQWYAWDRNHWTPAEERLMQSARFVGGSVAYEQSIDNPRDQERHYRYSTSYTGINNMIKLAISMMSVSFDEVSDLTIMACKNGIINRITGDFTPIEECYEFREQYSTIYIDCEYHAGWRSENWHNHIMTVFSDNTTRPPVPAETAQKNAEIIAAYFKRLLGYSLYAGNPERLFMYWWGHTTNGKSTTQNVITQILGAQAGQAPLSQIYVSDTDKPAPAVYDCLPKTIAFFSEASGDSGSKISSASFKELSGDKYTSKFRKMHCNNEMRRILCLPIGITNALPKYDNAADPAVLKRMLTIPFLHTFTTENKTIDALLLKDSDRIFSEMVDDLRIYCQQGLPPAPNLLRLNQVELIIGSDLYAFMTMGIEPTASDGSGERMKRSALKEAYLSWCHTHDIDVETRIERDGDLYREVLKKSETIALMAAVRVCGFAEITSHGTRYICARRRPAEPDENTDYAHDAVQYIS